MRPRRLLQLAVLTMITAATGLLAMPATAAGLLHYEVSGHLVRQRTEFVPANIDSFLQSQFDGQAVQLSFDLDPATVDTDASATAADYRGAVTASSLRIGGVDMLELSFCAGSATIDCSVVLQNDQPAFGGLLDSYMLRSRNFQLGSGTPLDGMVHLLSFLFSTGQFSLAGAPGLLSSTALDPGLAALMGGRPQDFSINLQESGGCSQCLFASWGIDGLQIRAGDDAVTGVPEPASVLLALAALAAAGRFSRSCRQA